MDRPRPVPPAHDPAARHLPAIDPASAQAAVRDRRRRSASAAVRAAQTTCLSGQTMRTPSNPPHHAARRAWEARWTDCDRAETRKNPIGKYPYFYVKKYSTGPLLTAAITAPELPARLPPRDYEWPNFVPFVVVHLLPFAALWTGSRPVDWVVCAALYFVRVFGVMAGYHRYFSHRAFKTSRWFQFVLAVLAESTLQKGVLWWAARHRSHHKHTDEPEDVHSPLQYGFWHSHMLWLAERDSELTDDSRIRDLTKYPELVWIDRHWLVPPVALALVVGLTLGWSGLLIGFFLSTVLVWHATFVVNSLAHVFGSRRFDTADTSRNNWLIALFTLGEGWHNNHHHYVGSARQGFFWWEIDVTYYVLRCLAWCGIVSDLRSVPAAVLAEGRALDAARRAAR